MSGFDTEVYNDKAGVLISGVDKYRQFLHNLIETRVYDRWFSLFGIDLEDSIFENYTDDDIEFNLITKLDNAVNRYIPELKISYRDSEVVVDRNDNEILIRLVFKYGGDIYEEEIKVSV
jgi:phage baseplate assembly protein W